MINHLFEEKVKVSGKGKQISAPTKRNGNCAGAMTTSDIKISVYDNWSGHFNPLY